MDMQPESQTYNLIDFLIVIGKRRKLVFGITMGAALIGIVWSLAMPNIYRANTKILPPEQSKSAAAAILGQLGSLADVAGNSLGIKNPSDLFISLLKSRAVEDVLIQKFKLLAHYHVKTVTNARKALENATVVDAGKDGIINISVDDKNPVLAAAMANAYVDTLYSLTQRLAISEPAQRRHYFETQLRSAKDDLTKAELALKQTEEATGVFQLNGQTQAMVNAIADLKAKIAAKQVQLSTLRSYATDQNPEFINANNEIAALRQQLEKVEAGSPGKGDVLLSSDKLAETSLEYSRKLRDVKYYEAVFELISKQFEAAKLDEAKEGPLIQVLDKAITPEMKIRPHRAILVLLSTFLGAGLAIGVALLLEALEKAKGQPEQWQKLILLKGYFSFKK